MLLARSGFFPAQNHSDKENYRPLPFWELFNTRKAVRKSFFLLMQLRILRCLRSFVGQPALFLRPLALIGN